MQDKTENIKPYEDCEHCEFQDNRCYVDNKFQRLPRSEGGLAKFRKFRETCSKLKILQLYMVKHQK